MPMLKNDRISASFGNLPSNITEKENRASRVDELISKSPFIFKGRVNVSPLGEFDFLSGKSRIPCTTVVSQSAKYNYHA